MAEPDSATPPDLGAATHPSRRFQERLLADPADLGAWHGLRTSYDEMAAGWRAWTTEQPGYDHPVRDGLTRTRPAQWALEICCGTGEATPAIAAAVPTVFPCDLNPSMVARRVQVPGVDAWFAADVSALPVGTGTVPLLVSLNGVFHPTEIARVLQPGGQLLWCTSFRSGTPLYVPPERLRQLLSTGTEWAAEHGRSGHGEWTLLTAPGG